MSIVTRKIVLDTLIKHETLKIEDITKPENLGIVADEGQVKFLLTELKKSGYIEVLNGIQPITYTITEKGIEEGKRLEVTF